jgi:PhzF family phenazine biosynthesis protein
MARGDEGERPASSRVSSDPSNPGDDPTRPPSFPLAYRLVDAFTPVAFGGNPAAVILPGPGSDSLSDDHRQAIAAEMNLSETAFPGLPDPSGHRGLRWFTPTTEVSLCGHATLAAAQALLEQGEEPPFRFKSLSGILEVDREGDELRLDFPGDPPRRTPAPPGLLDALGLPAETPFLTGARSSLVPVADPATVQALRPQMAALAAVELPPGVMGVSVTACTGPRGFTSRFFGPWVGVDEDPVTGMAHTVLGPYWAHHLEVADGEVLDATQGGVRRGELRVRVQGERVHLLGHAVTVAEGRILLQKRATTLTSVRPS